MSNRFKVGDIVIANTSKTCKHNPRQAGEKYKVLAVHNCRNCNEELICINNSDLPKLFAIACSCGDKEFSSNKPWTKASNFTMSTGNLHIELQLAIEREDYEYAAKLRDQINQQ